MVQKGLVVGGGALSSGMWITRSATAMGAASASEASQMMPITTLARSLVGGALRPRHEALVSARQSAAVPRPGASARIKWQTAQGAYRQKDFHAREHLAPEAVKGKEATWRRGRP